MKAPAIAVRLVLQPEKSIRWSAPLEGRRVKEMSKKLGPIDDPRSRASEIGVRIHRVHAAVSDRRKLGRARIAEKLSSLLGSLCQFATAGHDDQNFWRPTEHVTPRDANGVRALSPEFVDAARDPHHLGNPMPGTVDRINPLHAEDAGPSRHPRGSRGDPFQPISAIGNYFFRFLQPVRRCAELP